MGSMILSIEEDRPREAGCSPGPAAVTRLRLETNRIRIVTAPAEAIQQRILLTRASAALRPRSCMTCE